MKLLNRTLNHVHYAITHIWDCDPLRRRPLSQLAVQESRLRPHGLRRRWAALPQTRHSTRD